MSALDSLFGLGGNSGGLLGFSTPTVQLTPYQVTDASNAANGLSPAENQFLANFKSQPSTTLNTSNPFDSFFSSLTGPTQGFGLQPGNSPTPNTGAGRDLFSDIAAGIGGTLRTFIPQFTTALAQGGLTQLEQSTFKGTKTGPTTASPTALSALGGYGPILLVGGGLLVLVLLLRK